MSYQQNTNDKPSVIGMIFNSKKEFQKIVSQPIVSYAMLIIVTLSVITALLTNENLFMAMVYDLNITNESDLILMYRVAKVMIAVVSAIIPIVAILLLTIVYFIIAKLLKSTITFKQMFSLQTHVSFIAVLGALINGIIYYYFDGLYADIPYTSINYFIEELGPLSVYYNAIDLFIFWYIIVSVIGLQFVARFSKKSAWISVIAVMIISHTLFMMLIYQDELGWF